MSIKHSIDLLITILKYTSIIYKTIIYITDLTGTMSEDSHLPHILNLGNSIIGVTVLAMPFCYKEVTSNIYVVQLFFASDFFLSPPRYN